MLALRLRPLSLICVTALLSACAATSPGERYTPPPAGTTFLSTAQSTGSYGNGPSEIPGLIVQADWKGTRVTGFQTPQNTILVMDNGGFVAMLAPDGKPINTWDPPLVWEFPLEVGKTWTKKYTITMSAQNTQIPFEVRQTVEAYENLVLPAGTFKSYRVRTSDTLGNENVHWFSPEAGVFVKASLRRTDKSAQGAGTRESELKSTNLKR
ncbi:MAG: hypothetical protein ACAH21_08795 [Ramlibacter sp.]|nr:hypothetical protein [Ramlibacter sp.]